MRTLLIALGMTGVMLSLSVDRTAAQDGGDCGENCLTCGDDKWEGITHSEENAVYNMTCILNVDLGGCHECETETSSTTVRAVSIAKAAEAITQSEVGALVAAYGDRLLLNVDKNALVVMGTDCDADRVGAYVYLSPGKVQAIAEAGVRSYKHYLALAR